MKTFLACALLAASFATSAGTTATPLLTQDQTSNSNSDATANNAGNAQMIIFEGSKAGSVDLDLAQINGATARDVANSAIRNTPSVSGPPLVSSNDTCMGSASGSINAPGIGIALGKTYTDDNCVMLKNSRELWNMGMKAAALARMCFNAENRDSLEMTGFVCAQTERDRKLAEKTGVQTATVVSNVEYTDPIIRARLGLTPLPATK